MSKERGNFEGDDTITAAELHKQRESTFGYVAADEIRIDNENVIVLPNSAAVHRMPPANPHIRVEREGKWFRGTFHGLSPNDDLRMPQRIAGEKNVVLMINVGDGYYTVWGRDLEKDLRRR